MLLKSIKLVIGVVAALAICCEASAQSGSTGFANSFGAGSFGGSGFGGGFSGGGGGFADTAFGAGGFGGGGGLGGYSSYGALGGAGFTGDNSCGRAITQSQAASLWSGYCTESCAYQPSAAVAVGGGGFSLPAVGGGGFSLPAVGGGCASGACDQGGFGYPAGGGCGHGGCKLGGLKSKLGGGCLSCKRSAPSYSVDYVPVQVEQPQTFDQCGSAGGYFDGFVGADYGNVGLQSSVSGCATGSCGGGYAAPADLGYSAPADLGYSGGLTPEQNAHYGGGVSQDLGGSAGFSGQSILGGGSGTSVQPQVQGIVNEAVQGALDGAIGN